MQSKDNKMSNFLLYIRTIFSQALKESLKELKESKLSLSTLKITEREINDSLKGIKGDLKIVFKPSLISL